ncbi:MAG: hypothetical protein CFH41_02173 [Alphaproteobacteria bacterium MarineAlpha11_Bin1]|nr:MAG: hypothetical protein CFH41_02173 [Alphaproteobacteria bacterium MarineAlpha11_Bin1]|tara:strand:- start:966 stop:1202 length:237 start_codon:yes stop_codon:yes gene_type:complete
MEQAARIQEPKNTVWQTRGHEQTEFEHKLSLAMEKAFADGVTELDALVDRLNEDGVLDEQDLEWTVGSFRTLMAELGA